MTFRPRSKYPEVGWQWFFPGKIQGVCAFLRYQGSFEVSTDSVEKHGNHGWNLVLFWHLRSLGFQKGPGGRVPEMSRIRFKVWSCRFQRVPWSRVLMLYIEGGRFTWFTISWCKRAGIGGFAVQSFSLERWLGSVRLELVEAKVYHNNPKHPSILIHFDPYPSFVIKYVKSSCPGTQALLWLLSVLAAKASRTNASATLEAECHEGPLLPSRGMDLGSFSLV